MPIELMYIIMAASGQYAEDRLSWLVAVLPSLQEANTFREAAAKASKEVIEAYRSSEEGKNREFLYFREPTKYDLNHEVYGAEVRYTVQPVPLLRNGLPQDGLLSIAGQYANAEALCRESNRPGISQFLGLPVPKPQEPIVGDFADKLRAALSN